MIIDLSPEEQNAINEIHLFAMDGIITWYTARDSRIITHGTYDALMPLIGSLDPEDAQLAIVDVADAHGFAIRDVPKYNTKRHHIKWYRPSDCQPFQTLGTETL